MGGQRIRLVTSLMTGSSLHSDTSPWHVRLRSNWTALANVASRRVRYSSPQGHVPLLLPDCVSLYTLTEKIDDKRIVHTACNDGRSMQMPPVPPFIIRTLGLIVAWIGTIALLSWVISKASWYVTFSIAAFLMGLLLVAGSLYYPSLLVRATGMAHAGDFAERLALTLVGLAYATVFFHLLFR